MSALLSVVSVWKRFAGVTALSGVCLDVRAGSITGVIGPNGSGKTTLMNVVTGVTQPDEGRVLLGGVEIDRMRPHRIAGLGIARSFQGIRLFMEKSALENVLLGTHLHRHAGVLDAFLRLPRLRREEREARRRGVELLERLGLGHLAELPAGQLSYGDRRRVEIARALATRPRLLLLDEPAAGMNATEKRHLSDLIRQVRDGGITIVLVEHDMDLVMSLCDEIEVLNFGERIARGSPAAVRKCPAVLQAYLGDESHA